MRIGFVLLLAVIVVVTPPSLHAEEARYPTPPGEREFVRDEAALLTLDQENEVRGICTALLDAKRVPILVVTLTSLSAYGADDVPIEVYAKSLFDEWGIGFPEWNHGMLLLVSAGDRKARIQLGAAWGRARDDDMKRIMDEQILEEFRFLRYGTGIVAGVRSLDLVARGLELPPKPEPPPYASRPWYQSPWILGLMLFVVGSLISIRQGGRTSWGWKAWAWIFKILGMLLVLSTFFRFLSGGGRGGSSGGGSSSGGGGSFGGGSSGGGGASGSW